MLITSDDHDWIRKRIDGSLTQAAVPPNLIETYLDEAEEWVADRVDVEGLAEGKLVNAKRAAKYYCASLIAPTVNIPKSDSVAGVGASYTRDVMRPEANAARLLQKAIEEMEKATSADTPPATVRPTFFTVAPGRRGL